MRDVEFLRKIISDVAGRYNINRKRVYSTGISQGGIMSYRLACEATDLVAAIAPVAAQMANKHNTCQPSRKIPILHFHGTDDQYVLYQKGVGHMGVRITSSIEELIDYWVEKNDLAHRITKTKTIGRAEYKQYGSMASGVVVGLWTLQGGGHTWPGGRVKKFLGETNRDINASELMWDFFQQFSLP